MGCTEEPHPDPTVRMNWIFILPSAIAKVVIFGTSSSQPHIRRPRVTMPAQGTGLLHYSALWVTKEPGFEKQLKNGFFISGSAVSSLIISLKL